MKEQLFSLEFGATSACSSYVQPDAFPLKVPLSRRQNGGSRRRKICYCRRWRFPSLSQQQLKFHRYEQNVGADASVGHRQRGRSSQYL